MRTIAIITARGGSKRIPKKNIKEFCGKPIIAYSIEAAIESKVFDEVMVSTDSIEIAEIAQKYGAKVPFLRSETTSNDYASTAEVLEEVLSQYAKQGREFELFCCIYPTAPFVSASKLKGAVEKCIVSGADSLVPVVQFSFPPQRGFIISNGQLKYQYPEFAAMRSQDLDAVYHDCGQFYVCRTESFKKYHTIVMPNTVSIIVPETEVQDIDNESDWRIAEIKYRTLALENKGENHV